MDSKTLVESIINFVAADPENSWEGKYRYFDEPLVGFADANDPIFTDFKKENIIGPVFLPPKEWLSNACTVISFFLPFTSTVLKSNYQPGIASDEWMHARFKGDAFLCNLRRFVVTELEKAGGTAMAPHIEPEFQADIENGVSNWSERHIAYAAGLGTFSLNRGLITQKGMAGRFGSVVTSLSFEPTARTFKDPFENCLFCREEKCGSCIQRCPAKAISKEGKDKKTCYQYLLITNPRQGFNEKHGYPYSGCGKCQTNVPCEHKIP